MSVMERMRGGSDSTIVQLLLAGVLVSFVAYYGQDHNGSQGSNVAVVNGAAITDVEFNRLRMRYDDAGMSDDQKAEMHAMIVDNLVEAEVIRQAADDADLHVAEQEIAATIFDEPVFHDDAGNFDMQIYENSLKRMQTSKIDFETRLRDQELGNRARSVAFMGGTVTDEAAMREWIKARTTVDIEYVRVTSFMFIDDINPTPAELTAFAEQNATRIQDAYDADFQTLYNKPASVDYRLIRLVVRPDGVPADALAARLDALKAQIVGGADMGELARQFSEDSSAESAGLVLDAENTELDSALAAALEGKNPGEFVELRDDTQVRLVFVEGRKEARTIPIEEVRDAIAKDLYAKDEAPSRAAKFAEDLQAAWAASGQVPTDMVDAQHLIVERTGPISPTGAPDVKVPSKMLTQAAGAPGLGTLSGPVEDKGVYFVGALAARETPDTTEYEGEKAAWKEALLTRRQTQFYADWKLAAVSNATVKR